MLGRKQIDQLWVVKDTADWGSELLTTPLRVLRSILPQLSPLLWFPIIAQPPSWLHCIDRVTFYSPTNFQVDIFSFGRDTAFVIFWPWIFSLKVNRGESSWSHWTCSIIFYPSTNFQVDIFSFARDIAILICWPWVSYFKVNQAQRARLHSTSCIWFPNSPW
jgi:hypothetical protein